MLMKKPTIKIKRYVIELRSNVFIPVVLTPSGRKKIDLECDSVDEYRGVQEQVAAMWRGLV